MPSVLHINDVEAAEDAARVAYAMERANGRSYAEARHAYFIALQHYVINAANGETDNGTQD